MGEPRGGRSRAVAVAGGILASRLAGFGREVVQALFFGVGPHADVLRVAFRGPNVLQNLLGEGTLAAAFIPIYSRLLRQGREADAGRFAGAALGLLLTLVSALVVLGVLLAPWIVTVLAFGFVDDAEQVVAGQLVVDRFPLAVAGVRIVFPMTGLLVLSAWALAVLNSHRRFFVAYAAPVLWNTGIVAALFIAATWWMPSGGGAPASALERLDRLLLAAFLGGLVGGLLQLLVQLPWVFREMRGFRLSASIAMPEVREGLRTFGPVVAGRGAYQISAWVDLVLASLLAAGAVGALGYAQTLYLLPVSLFAMSVAASELPELSRLESGQVEGFLERLDRSLRQILFLTVPTAVGYLLFGLPLVRGLFERGRFGRSDGWLVYLVLAAYTVGLLATAVTRLLQNAFYALRDTRTPARIAVARVVCSTLFAVPLMVWLDRYPVTRVAGAVPGGEGLFLGACGLAAGVSIGAWLELALLRRALAGRIALALPAAAALRMGSVALAAASLTLAAWWLLPPLPAVATAAVVVGLYAALYLGAARALRFPELASWLGRFGGHRPPASDQRPATSDRG